MGATFKMISWTPFKKRFDIIMAIMIALYLIIYAGSLFFLYPNIQPQLLIIKSTGSLSVIMIHFILMLGPLSRINKKILPLLYNRRHLGVTLFLVTLIHGVMSLLYYQGFGTIGIMESLFRSTNNYSHFEGFPFMILGFGALIILFFMAITSHDFWLEKLSPKIWKYLHMLVYLAYALIIGHIFTGALQRDVSVAMHLLYYTGILSVVGLNLYAAFCDYKMSKQKTLLLEDGYIPLADANDIPSDRAKVIHYKDQSIAVFKYDNKLSAVHNYCKHQGGPLGEGKILDGCITCPWHGFQYQPHNGQAPPPFNEKIATFDLKLVGNEVFLNPNALPEGTEVEPLVISDDNSYKQEAFFVGWEEKIPPILSHFLKRSVLVISVIALFAAIAIPFMSQELKDSQFTFGELKEYEGTLSMQPVPRISIADEDFLLVDFGKFSASKSIRSYEKKNNIQLNNQRIKIEGTEISYDGHKLIELSNKVNSILEHKKINTQSINSPTKVDLGSVTITGEILDAKCFFGVMNPGEGPVHKPCSALCVQGGIPAVIYNKDVNEYYVIKGESGNDINQELVPLAGEIVKISGTSYRYNNWRYIDVNSKIIQLSFKNALDTDVETLCNVFEMK